MKKWLSWGVVFFSFLFSFPFLWSIYLDHYFSSWIFSSKEAPFFPIGIIFGASISPQKSPSPPLMERLDKGIELYFQGKIQKLLLTGDNTKKYYKEVDVMKKYVENRGVPRKDLILDPQGVDTETSLKRAKEIFHIPKALLITQKFHLPRALYIASSIGLEAKGVYADSGRFSPSYWLLIREVFAKMWYLIKFRRIPLY